MKHKLLNKLWLRVGIIVAVMTTALAGTAAAEDVTTTYRFTSKSWEAMIYGTDVVANWTSGKDGNQLTSGQGIQVTTGVSGANGTSPVSYSNVSKVVVRYCTNASKGEGTIKVQVGSNSEQSFSVTKPSSGGTDLKDATFNYDTPETGNIKVTGECSTNSIYIYSVTITYSSGGGSTFSVTYDANGATGGSVPTDNTSYISGATVTVLGNTGSLAKAGYTFGGWNTQDDGLGTNYTDGNTFTISANTTLYAKWNPYTITAVSNNDSYGTVSGTTTITATPEEGYRVVAGNGGYDVTSGSATVTNNGDNTFSVTPSSDCTVQINFEAIPTHTATFSVNGETTSDTFQEGADIEFPSDPYDINSKTFVGWVTSAIVGTTNVEPNFVTSATMSTNDVTYYAVFATSTPGSETNTTKTITSSTSNIPTGYGSANTFTEYTLEGVKFKVQQMFANSSDLLQWRAAGNTNGTGTMYNTEALSKIQSIVLTYDSSDSNKNFTVSVGDSENPTSGTSITPTNDNLVYTYDCSSYNKSYFVLTNGSNAGYLASVAVTYKIIGPTTYSAYCTTVSSLPVPTIVFTNENDEVITSIDVTATEMTELGFKCLDETDDPMDVSISVTSNDETVAEYDEGYILAYKSGTVTLTATFAGNGSYQGTSTELTVNVAKAPSVTAVEVTVDNTDVYTATEDGLAVATVKDASGNAIGGATVTWNSSNTAVATIDESGNITLKGAGTTTITASYAGNDIYEASDDSYDLTLTSSKPQETEVTIELTSTTLGTTSPDGKTIVEEGINVTTNTGESSNALVATDAHVRMYKNSNMVVTAPSGYYVTAIEFTEPNADTKWDGDPTASIGTYSSSSKSWSGGANSVTFTFSGGQCRIASITVTLAETVTIGSAGYTTYVAKHNISFPDGLTAYISTSKTSETLTLTEKESVPQGTPIILEGSAGTYALPTITTSPEDVFGNLLQASDGSVTGNGSTIFALGVGKTGANVGKVGFYLVGSGVQVPAGKAYLVVGGAAKEFLTFDFEDDADGINSLTPALSEGEGTIYNLAGQRISKMQKGINIVNGKKIAIK